MFLHLKKSIERRIKQKASQTLLPTSLIIVIIDYNR